MKEWSQKSFNRRNKFRMSCKKCGKTFFCTGHCGDRTWLDPHVCYCYNCDGATQTNPRWVEKCDKK